MTPFPSRSFPIKEALFKPTFTVKAYFHNIEGLRNGAPVKLSGIDAGAVQNIKVVGDSVSLIEVKMRLLKEIKHFIRVDTQAEIQTEGLVGNKFVSLKIGVLMEVIGSYTVIAEKRNDKGSGRYN